MPINEPAALEKRKHNSRDLMSSIKTRTYLDSKAEADPE